MLTSTLQDRLRRASALTGLEPAEMVRCAISEWLQRLEQPPLPFASAVPLALTEADPAPAPTPAPVPVAAPKKRGRRRSTTTRPDVTEQAGGRGGD